MALPVAVLVPAGAGNTGQQVKGVTAQYQSDAKQPGVAEVPNTSGVHPYDSGTILGTVPPGKAGIKLVAGIVQRSSQIISTQVAGSTGNALTCTSGVGVVPAPPAGSENVDGLSQAPQHE
jgi:hypothetical protein